MNGKVGKKKNQDQFFSCLFRATRLENSVVDLKSTRKIKKGGQGANRPDDRAMRMNRRVLQN